MKRIIFLSVCCVVALNLFAQRATEEQPYGLTSRFEFHVNDPCHPFFYVGTITFKINFKII